MSVFVTLGISMQCACAILSTVACLAVLYFTHYVINSTIFEKKKFIERKMCALIFCTNVGRNISHSKKKGERYDQACMSVFM